ncbi:LOW QUALITY PROTEIN: homeobox protein prospero [Centruroides vittatus]|uniref:LOW QUALITY PROTEIN: homeobox protein prospero n=1 Tax=Centruroides vittatus TaxID=120091 RepID=UPI00350FB3C5
MMSSEEDSEMEALKNKTKRVRQRVDAGEPRNSYASIPNFSSRPMATVPYHNGFSMLAGGKILGDLISRHQKGDMMLDDLRINGSLMASMDMADSSFLNGTVDQEMTANSPHQQPPGSPLPENSHLLRDILQGRKVSDEQGPCVMLLQGNQPTSVSHAPETSGVDTTGSHVTPRPRRVGEEDDNVKVSRMSDQEQETTPYSPSPCQSPNPLRPLSNSNTLEEKRARVETIVSNMLQGPPATIRSPGQGQSGPEPPTPVNGCKKRKLYQPQQHEASRITNGLQDDDDEEDDEEELSPPKQRRLERETLKLQLRQMQEQLAAMQQRYLELFEFETSVSPMRDNPSPRSEDGIPMNATDVKAEMSEDKHEESVNCRQSCIVQPPTRLSPGQSDVDWLSESLKSEITSSLSQVIDAVISRYVQRRPVVRPATSSTGTNSDSDQPKDSNLLSQMLDRKSPRSKVIDRGCRVNGHSQRSSPFPDSLPKPTFFYPPGLKPPMSTFFCNTAQQLPSVSLPFPPPGLNTSGIPVEVPEQTEAMALVVTPKKKRHKVTDTRITPRTVSRVLGQDVDPLCNKYTMLAAGCPSDPGPAPTYTHHPPPPPLVPVSLPTSVAIPNPSLHQSDVFTTFHYDHQRLGQYNSIPDNHDEDALHSSIMSHARGSPDSLHYGHLKLENGDSSEAGDSPAYESGLAMTSTLTPMHLRKAKLMFFYVRYPSSAVLKMYFPDIKFNKNNTAQLVKWFSNFREFYYIQMEKYARQSVSEGVKNNEDLKVTPDSELLRVLNLHYNRNNHIEVPEHFRHVVEQTLKEFFKAITAGKDQEQSWKKSIYKVIARMDNSVPDYFKSPNFLEQLE